LIDDQQRTRASYWRVKSMCSANGFAVTMIVSLRSPPAARLTRRSWVPIRTGTPLSGVSPIRSPSSHTATGSLDVNVNDEGAGVMVRLVASPGFNST